MNARAAYEAGYDAYWDGVQREDNPYEPQEDPLNHKAWLEGWKKAREHDYDESEG